MPQPAKLSGSNSVPVAPRIRVLPVQDEGRRSPPLVDRDREFIPNDRDRERDLRPNDEPPNGMLFGGRPRGNSFNGSQFNGPPSQKPRAPSASPQNYQRPLPDTRRPPVGRRTQSYQPQQSNNYEQPLPQASEYSGISRWGKAPRIFEPRPDYKESNMPPPPRPSTPPGSSYPNNRPDLERRPTRSPNGPSKPMAEEEPHREVYPPPIQDPINAGSDDVSTSEALPVHPNRVKLLKEPSHSPVGRGGSPVRGRRQKNTDSRKDQPARAHDSPPAQRPSKQSSLLDRLSNPSGEAKNNNNNNNSAPSLRERVGGPPQEKGWKRNGGGHGQGQQSQGVSLQERLEASNEAGGGKNGWKTASGNGHREREGQRGGYKRGRGRGH
ncbi:hypothetical protein M422DRAFT_784710 [Sphaerobolus stellatus SS14]|uniref:Uncharacterized protein n=1 Tax=Sphaerobolus stellatus (strain SS14) TaxID=990650 RepID=A0A0C9TF58_SPHS4|nr:hypothetical protein M422DRAFT_784710 [Sphaerobolus stellatus SS14]